MAEDSQSSPLFQADLDDQVDQVLGGGEETEDTNELLRQLVLGQERQNELLEDLLEHLCSTQRQRAHELGQWRAAHPVLARKCRIAADALGRIQTEFLEQLAEDVSHNQEALADGDFLLNEFVDRYGPRLAHLNGVLQVLAQLGSGAPVNG